MESIVVLADCVLHVDLRRCARNYAIVALVSQLSLADQRVVLCCIWIAARLLDGIRLGRPPKLFKAVNPHMNRLNYDGLLLLFILHFNFRIT